MYYVQLQYNSGAWRNSPVKFLSKEMAELHAEKLADQFPDISNYRVASTAPCNILAEALRPFNDIFQAEIAK